MTDRSALLGLIDAVRGTSVLCIGDVMLDHFLHGTVDRVSPEAPVPVLKLDYQENSVLGGAGNVVRNLVSLGAQVDFVTVIGGDDSGRRIMRLVEDLEIGTDAVLRDDERRTSTKTRYLAGGQQILRTDRETVHGLGEAMRAAVMANAREAMSKCATVVISDYGKGILHGGVARELIEAARRSGKYVIVDPKTTDYGCYRGANLLTPNLKELSEAARMPVGNDGEIAAAARTLIDGHAIDAVLATLGADGMTLVTADGAVAHLAAEAREVFDVSGAGDTVVATMAAALGAGATLTSAADLANVAAGIVVGKVGTAVAYTAELAAALRHQNLFDVEARVAELQPALDRVHGWRRQGLRVAFTNGCFEFLHPGHVSLLSQAKEGCDRLVVGLNSDSSVKRLKGPDRPVQSEAARATVLASLATVDMVVIFGEDTPLELIEAIRPDVLVKGADYTLDQVVGAEFVQSYGGSVLLAELTPGHSTSATIARIAK